MVRVKITATYVRYNLLADFILERLISSYVKNTNSRLGVSKKNISNLIKLLHTILLGELAT